jgi:hypothetical protein
LSRQKTGLVLGALAARILPTLCQRTAQTWGKTKAEEKSQHRAVVRTLSTIEPERITWLWRGRLACGKLTLIAGDPGLGKSSVTQDIAAHISTGTLWPDGGVAPKGDVVLLTASG